MKSLKYLLVLCVLAVSISFSSCGKQYTPKDLEGTWVLESSDATAPLLFVSTYHLDGSTTIGLQVQNQRNFKSKWIETYNNSYRLRGNRLIEKGGDAHTPSFRVTKRIDKIDSTHMYVTIKKHISNAIDQMAFQKPYSQVFKKVEKDENVLLGTTWDIIQPTHGYRFIFKENHLYEFYEYKNGIWEIKQSNEGDWYVYGNLLCTNFYNDALGKEERFNYVSSCVYFEIEDSIMFWRTYDNTYPFLYILEKVSN